MGISQLAIYAVIEADRTADWSAGHAWIDRLQTSNIPEELRGSVWGLESVEEFEHDLVEIRSGLHDALDAFRDHVEGRRHGELNELRVRGANVYVTGGPSVGSVPTELYLTMEQLVAAGILLRCGFEAAAEA